MAKVIASATMLIASLFLLDNGSRYHVEKHVTNTTISNQTYSKATVQLVSDYLIGKWNKVAWCETHGRWSRAGYKYDGGLGIMPINWITYGGLEYAPSAHLATPQQQILIAIRINGNFIPDQDGNCHPW
jgi:hypothetical protein